MSPIQHIGATLTSLGWNTEELQTYSYATKVYATAVGPKEAHAYVRFAPDQLTARLSSEYWSEGRNALSTCSQDVPVAPADALADAIRSFSSNVDRIVGDTYAMRLARHIPHPMGKIAPTTDDGLATKTGEPGAPDDTPASDASPPDHGGSSEMAPFDTASAIASIRHSACGQGPIRAEFDDGQGFHELIVERDGTLSLNAFAGTQAPIATTLEDLPERVLRCLLNACGQPAGT